jgi:hypothetical protein
MGHDAVKNVCVVAQSKRTAEFSCCIDFSALQVLNSVFYNKTRNAE